MNKRSVVFIICLLILIMLYLYATNKMVVFNHSNQAIQKILITSEFSNKEITNIKENAVLKFTFFSPLDKKVKIKVEQPNNIRTVTFTLKGFFLGEQYNQVEITPTGEIRQGTLGLKQ